MTSIITPVPKPNTDPLTPLSYRPISLISIPCKIYADILNKRLTNWLETNDLLAEEQNGFRKERSCIDHLYTLTSLIRNRKIRKKQTFVCFIDAKKAFDSVNRDMLWYKLMKIGVTGSFLNAVKSLYDVTNSSVKLGTIMTDFFPVNSGVKQGCKISPTLFSVYINDLVSEINAHRAGVDIDEELNIAILLYADDIALIAPDEDSLQAMLETVDSWCKRWRLTINTEKTKILHFRGNSVRRSQYHFKCGDLDIDNDSCYRYLGVTLNEFLDYKFTVKELAKSASRALSALYTKFLYCGGMTYDVFTKLYTTLVEPVLFYGAGIWGIHKWKDISVVQNKACRYFLGLRKNASNVASRGDMGFMCTHSKQLLESFRLLLRIRSFNDNRYAVRIHEVSLNLQKSWDSIVLQKASDFNIMDIINRNCSTKLKMNLIKEVIFEKDCSDWYLELHNDRNLLNGNKLRTFREYKSFLSVSPYVNTVKNRTYRKVYSNFRSGSLPLAIETGRYAKPIIPLEQRLCNFCNENMVEDETHFILHCDLYSDIRYELYEKATKVCCNFILLNDKEKMCFLMNNVNLQHDVAKTLYAMFNRRKMFL